jgi:hypothetical protein
VDHNNRPLTVYPDDCVILCSDGLYRGVGEGEMVSAFHFNLQRGCDFLVHRVLSKQRKKQDNLTIIALKAGDSSRSTRRHPARTALLTLMALLLISLSGTATYWYLRRPATVEQKPAPGKPPAPDVPVDVAGKPNPAKSDSKRTETKQPPPQTGEKDGKASSSKKEEKPQPPKKGSSTVKPKPEHGTPDNQAAGETKTATPTGTTPPTPQQTPEQGGAAVTTPPVSTSSADAGKESPSGQPPDTDKDKDKDKKTTSPSTSPDTKPNSTNPPPSNANPPDPNSNPPSSNPPSSNPPNPNPPNPNSPNLARSTPLAPKLVDDHSSSLQIADLPGEMKGPESLCRS